jgi:hypothetical protein
MHVAGRSVINRPPILPRTRRRGQAAASGMAKRADKGVATGAVEGMGL